MPSACPTPYGSRHAVSARHSLPAAAGSAILEGGGSAREGFARRTCSVEAILRDGKTGCPRAGADARQPARAMVSHGWCR